MLVSCLALATLTTRSPSLACLADDHALVAHDARADEHLAARLQRVERERDGLLGGHRDHRAVLAAAEVAPVRAVLGEVVEERAPRRGWR